MNCTCTCIVTYSNTCMLKITTTSAVALDYMCVIVILSYDKH